VKLFSHSGVECGKSTGGGKIL